MLNVYVDLNILRESIKICRVKWFSECGISGKVKHAVTILPSNHTRKGIVP